MALERVPLGPPLLLCCARHSPYGIMSQEHPGGGKRREEEEKGRERKERRRRMLMKMEAPFFLLNTPSLERPGQLSSPHSLHMCHYFILCFRIREMGAS